MKDVTKYTALFGKESNNWSHDPEINLLFLRHIQSYANDRLELRGHIFLNEIFDEVGVPRTAQGQLVGWMRSSGNPVEFAMKIGDEGEITLTFSPDGIIIDKI